jgi:hypothetical protein
MTFDIVAFPLARAVLCVNCDCVSNTPDSCPECGSTALLNMGRLLGVMPVQESGVTEDEIVIDVEKCAHA